MIDLLTLLNYFIFSIALSAIAINITDYSYICLKIKHFLKFFIVYDKKLILFSKITTYYKILPRFLFYLTLPITILIVVVLKIHQLLNDILYCRYCLSYHLGWLTFFFYFNQPIITSLMLGGLTVATTYLLTKLIDD